MMYLKIYNDEVAKKILEEYGCTEIVGPFEALVDENINYVLANLADRYNHLSEEDLGELETYLQYSWTEIYIDEDDIQDQLRDLALKYIEEDRFEK